MLNKKARPDYDIEFTASCEWFKSFKNCYSSWDVKVSGDSVSADMKAAEELLETLDKLIVKGNHLPG